MRTSGFRPARTTSVLERAAERLLLAIGGVTSGAVGYLLLIAVAAARGRHRDAAGPGTAPRWEGSEGRRLRFIVLIPAHNEEGVLPATLRSLEGLDHPRDSLRIVVVADNSQDETAAVAVAHGADVLARDSPERGKGPALSWALEQIRRKGWRHDAVFFLDADCAPSVNALAAVEGRLRRGARAVQVPYVVANPDASWSSALRFAGFGLVNTVRPWGKDVLGLSCGILGSGFAVEREVLERHGWNATSLTEDTEFHLGLLREGVRVRFAPEAAVASPMPTTLRAAREQNARWESGRLRMVREWAPRLFAEGLRRRDPQLLHASLEGVIPSQSVLAAGTLLLAAGGGLLKSRPLLRMAVFSGAGQVLYVLGGLRLTRAPASVYRALVFAPGLVAWKLGLYLCMLAGRAPRDWQRTAR